MPLAALPKGDARHAGNLRFVQQRVGQFQAVFAAAGEAGEEVKRPLNRAAGDALNLVQRFDHKIAPRLVRIAHLGDDVLRAVQRRHAGVHGKGGRAGHRLAVQPCRQFDDGRGANQPAQSPAGHGIGFGQAINGEGAFGHAGRGGNGEVRTAVKHQFLINLVGNHVQVGFRGDGDHRRQFFRRQHAPGGVARVVDHQRLGARRESGPQRGGGDAEIVVGGQADGHRHAARQRDHWRVADPVGFEDEHFVAGVEHGR